MSVEADRALLRRFEPVIRYTRGESFFPMDVEPYVLASSLWKQRPNRPAVRLIPEGELTLEKLSEPRPDRFGTVYFLKFIEPLNIPELAAYALQEGLKKKDPKDVFRAGRGRLARVGYTSRLLDAVFAITLLARGRVPGDTAAAAARAYQKMMLDNERYCYHGRVVRMNDWIALQYWFFYPFNNWRSGFFGANDHEADWEMIYVYLSEGDDGEIRPEWVAYASHDFSGDDLRRRWDDPELEKVGEHPVIYSGAGSHASYYAPGEYLAELELPFMAPFARLVEEVQDFWRRILRHNHQEDDEGLKNQSLNIFRIPFVDYARGDGIWIGPGGDKEWEEPRLLSPAPAWAKQYYGLWGLYARDPVAGENAPAGPVYNRNGTVRRSWYDPLGWAGLDKVPPPNQALKITLERCKAIEKERAALEQGIAKICNDLVALEVEAQAMLGHPHLVGFYAEHQEKISHMSSEIREMRAKYAADLTLLNTLKFHAERLHRGERSPARSHIHRAHVPASDVGLRLSRFAETWSAISIGLVMLSFVAIILFARQYLFSGLLALASIIIFIEASFRRQLIRLISGLTIVLATISAAILIYEFFWTMIIVGVILSGGYIMWENIKELRS
jgi:hypothetical protein